MLRAASALALASLASLSALAAISCVLPDPAYARCRESCRATHDRCVVDAMNGAALQACDERLSACLDACSR